MKLFINTGGKGERLYPLTKDIPKPLISIAGKPILMHLIDWAKKHSINDIVFLNGHMADKIINYFEDGTNFGVKIIHSIESSPLGSGGCLKLARKHIESRIVHISGDLICDVDLLKMLSFHENKKADITVHVHKSSHPHDSDILDVDKEGRVLRFISKHDDHTNAGDLCNSGLSIIESNIFELMEDDVFTFETYLYPRLIENNYGFFAYYTDEFIRDAGTFDRLKKCEEFLLSQGGIA